MIGGMSTATWALLASEVVAAWIIWRLWRSDDHLFFKISLSLIALLPLLGPLLVLWVGNFPSKLPLVLQDRLRRSPDVFDRWRNVLEERNPIRRFRQWRNLMAKPPDEDR
jgi:hypothetical protein